MNEDETHMSLNDGHSLDERGASSSSLDECGQSRSERCRVTAMRSTEGTTNGEATSVRESELDATKEEKRNEDLRELSAVSRDFDSVFEIRRLERHHSL